MRKVDRKHELRRCKICERPLRKRNKTHLCSYHYRAKLNKNYLKGRRKEYAVIKKELAEGADIAFRSAGSHSPVDVVSINKALRFIKLIQCKPDSMSLKAKEKLCIEQKELDGLFYVKFIVE